LTRLAFVMTPALAKEAKAIAPVKESELPWPLAKPKVWRLDEAVVEVATIEAAPNMLASIPREKVVVPRVENLLVSVKRVEEAKVQVEVEYEYVRPEELTASAPAPRDERVKLPEKMLAPVKRLASPKRVDDANVQVEVEYEYKSPAPLTPTPPAVNPPTVNDPLIN